jgi:hypothetical protein
MRNAATRSDVVIDLAIGTDVRPAGDSDDLAGAWDYRAAAKGYLATAARYWMLCRSPARPTWSAGPHNRTAGARQVRSAPRYLVVRGA